MTKFLNETVIHQLQINVFSKINSLFRFFPKLSSTILRLFLYARIVFSQ